MYSFGARYRFKTYAAFRTNTYYRILQHPAAIGRALTPRVITVQRPDVFSYSRKLFKRVVDSLDKKTLCLKDSKNWTHTYQSSTNLFHKLVEEMRSKECIECFDSLSAGDLKLWKDMARLYLSSGYVELAGNLPWKLTQKIVTHQESGRSFDIPLWVPLCAVITKNHHAYFSEVDQDAIQSSIYSTMVQVL